MFPICCPYVQKCSLSMREWPHLPICVSHMLKLGPYVDLFFAICYHMLDNIWATYNLVVFENTQHMGHIWAAYGPHMGCPYVAHMWPICFGRSSASGLCSTYRKMYVAGENMRQSKNSGCRHMIRMQKSVCLIVTFIRQSKQAHNQPAWCHQPLNNTTTQTSKLKNWAHAYLLCSCKNSLSSQDINRKDGKYKAKNKNRSIQHIERWLSWLSVDCVHRIIGCVWDTCSIMRHRPDTIKIPWLGNTHWDHTVSTYWWQGWHPHLQLLLWLRTEVECSAVRGANLETVVESGQQCTTENKLIRTYTYTSISKSAQATVHFTHSP